MGQLLSATPMQIASLQANAIPTLAMNSSVSESNPNPNPDPDPLCPKWLTREEKALLIKISDKGECRHPNGTLDWLAVGIEFRKEAGVSINIFSRENKRLESSHRRNQKQNNKRKLDADALNAGDDNIDTDEDEDEDDDDDDRMILDETKGNSMVTSCDDYLSSEEPAPVRS